ncbi:MAG: hypothetical protein Q8936_06315 [Bacillota bacterium]|nr:hypothetical protein [Bacillota bacterium]
MYDNRDDFIYDIFLRIIAKLIDPTGKLNTYNNWKKNTHNSYNKNPFVTSRNITYSGYKVSNDEQRPLDNNVVEILNKPEDNKDYEIKSKEQDDRLTDNKVELQVLDNRNSGITLDFNLNHDNLAQAFVYSEILGKPRCQTRRRR